jgi:hypothetical protein
VKVDMLPSDRRGCLEKRQRITSACKRPKSSLTEFSAVWAYNPIQDAENGDSLGIALEPEGKRLSRAEFQGLSDMPPELEWFANLDNPHTRRAYRNDVKEFTAFAGVERREEMRKRVAWHRVFALDVLLSLAMESRW